MRSINDVKLSEVCYNHLRNHYPKKETFSFMDVAKTDGITVTSYHDLQMRVAELAVKNRNSILYFRGQKKDYRNRVEKNVTATTILPSIFRKHGITKLPLKKKWKLLNHASDKLLKHLYKNFRSDYNSVKKRQIIQWALLQHYEIVDTPLIDITQSLRIACSFAMDDRTRKQGSGYLYVFAMPFIHNRINRDSEEELTIVRLLSICPAFAKRPFFQEGFLVGEEEDISYGSPLSLTYDLRRRLIAKFYIENFSTFWGNDNPVSDDFIYPEEENNSKEMWESLRNEIALFK